MSAAKNRRAAVLRETVWAALLLSVAAYSEASQAAARIAVDLGTADGTPGSTVFVPLNIAVPEHATVTRLELDVQFDKNLLAFLRAEPTPLAKAEGVELSTAVEEDREDSTRSVLRVSATSTRGFTSSAIADLFFQISREATPTGSTSHKAGAITTVLKRTARVTAGGAELRSVEGRDGEIDITEGVALFGCFFYMH